MSIISDTVDEKTRRLSRDLAKQQEDILMSQLGDLIRNKILVIVETPSVITYDAATSTCRLEKAIRLQSREHEVIAELHAKVQTLTNQLAAARKALEP